MSIWTRLTAPAILAGAVFASGHGAAEEMPPLAAFLERIASADIVILGELHDNPGHHARQAQIVAALGPSALVFEMITAEEAARITPELAGDPEALERALDWSASGWPDFAMYYPLLAQAETRAVYGAEVPRDQMRAVFAEGAATVFTTTFDGDADRFGLSTGLPETEQTAREAGQQDAHCGALPEAMLPDFVAAQRLRDAVLAQAAVAALDAQGGPVVIITGNGHARRDWGVPAVLRTAAPDLTVITLGQFEAPPEGDLPFDFWVVSAPVTRPDACAAFR